MFDNIISTISSMGVQDIAAIVFVIFLTIFLYIKRKKLSTQLFFPILYMLLYRTKFGIKFMKKFADKHPKILKWTGYIGVVIGFLGMIFIMDFLLAQIVTLFIAPAKAQAVQLVLPVKAKGAVYVPFFFWIISIFIIALVHEMSHGIISNVHKIPVKSSGFAFLGIGLPLVPAAFVEPDEEILKKKSPWAQLSVFAAGPFSNIVLGIFFALIMLFIFNPIGEGMITTDGVVISSIYNDTSASYAGIGINEKVLFMDDTAITSSADITKFMKGADIGDTITLTTNVSEYSLTLGETSKDSQSLFMGLINKLTHKDKRPFMGIGLSDISYMHDEYLSGIGNIKAKVYFWFFELIFWLTQLNLGIGLFNLLPLGIVDGGRMFQIALLSIFKKKEQKELANKIWGIVGLIILLIILYMIFSGFL